MNRSDTETHLVTDSNSPTSSSSSASYLGGQYEALDSSDGEGDKSENDEIEQREALELGERVLTPTYPWDYEDNEDSLEEKNESRKCQNCHKR